MGVKTFVRRVATVHLPVAVAVGQYELVDAPLGQPVGQPTLVRGVRDLHPAEVLQRGMGHDDLFHRLAQRKRRVVFAAEHENNDDITILTVVCDLNGAPAVLRLKPIFSFVLHFTGFNLFGC